MGAERGDKYRWRGLLVEVTRVARDGSWADIRVTPANPASRPWTKRQRIPAGGLPAEWHKIAEPVPCARCTELIAQGPSGGWKHVTDGGKPAEPYNYGHGGGKSGMHLAAPDPRRAIRDDDPPTENCVRDTDGTILRGPCLPCGCPLDSGCDGWHPGRLP